MHRQALEVGAKHFPDIRWSLCKSYHMALFFGAAMSFTQVRIMSADIETAKAISADDLSLINSLLECPMRDWDFNDRRVRQIRRNMRLLDLLYCGWAFKQMSAREHLATA